MAKFNFSALHPLYFPGVADFRENVSTDAEGVSRYHFATDDADVAERLRGAGFSVTEDDVDRPALVVPPKSGAGSGREEWAAYAAERGVQVEADDSRDDIIAAVEAAPVPTDG